MDGAFAASLRKVRQIYRLLVILWSCVLSYTSDVSTLTIPFAFKLLSMELLAMNIACRYVLEDAI